MQKKILTLLVLLMTAVTGAWATEFTSLKVGDVLHVGDVINTSTNYMVCGCGLDANFQPATLVRGNISNWDITESETGAYYFLKDKDGYFFCYISDDSGNADYNGGYWPVTDTSDGISVTAITPGDYNTELTFAVHEAPAADPDYYLVGNMTSWGINPQYKLALNESAGDANEYQIAVALPAATELKVVSSTDGTTIKDWFPAEAGNKVVENDGLYTIYFRPGYNGGSDWHANCIYVADGVSFTADGMAWTLAQMPACDLELEVEYYPLATLATTPAAAEGLNDGTTADLLTPGTSTEGTLYYALGTSEAPTGQWSQTIPTTEGLEAGEYYVWYKVVGDAEHSDSEPQSIAVTVAAMPAFAVTIDDAGVDASNWQATPAEQRAGQTVTLSYGGKKKVKSITIEKAATAPAGPVTYTELNGGEVLHVGDIINPSEEISVNGDYYFPPSLSPFTVVRGNISGESATEDENGAYYLIKHKYGDFYFISEDDEYRLPVTSTSDGILVTYNGISWGNKSYTFTVHEP